MIDQLEILIAAPVFIILLITILQPVKQALHFSITKSVILSVCVSALAIIGLNSHFRNSTGVLLLPYTAMAICILLILLLSFISKMAGRSTKPLFDQPEKKKTLPKLKKITPKSSGYNSN
jgi:cytochrome bd-type quinol oxidase subunit 1